MGLVVSDQLFVNVLRSAEISTVILALITHNALIILYVHHLIQRFEKILIDIKLLPLDGQENFSLVVPSHIFR